MQASIISSRQWEIVLQRPFHIFLFLVIDDNHGVSRYLTFDIFVMLKIDLSTE